MERIAVFEKASCFISFIVLGIVISSSISHPLKRPTSISSNWLGRVTFLSFLQSMKAHESICVTESEMFISSTSVSSNAFSPILRMLFGNSIFVTWR